MAERLEVNCKGCGVSFPSPIAMDRSSFETATLTNNAYQCPACGEMKTYDKRTTSSRRPARGRGGAYAVFRDRLGRLASSASASDLGTASSAPMRAATGSVWLDGSMIMVPRVNVLFSFIDAVPLVL
jgi:hypothetical protein